MTTYVPLVRKPSLRHFFVAVLYIMGPLTEIFGYLGMNKCLNPLFMLGVITQLNLADLPK